MTCTYADFEGHGLGDGHPFFVGQPPKGFVPMRQVRGALGPHPDSYRRPADQVTLDEVERIAI